MSITLKIEAKEKKPRKKYTRKIKIAPIEKIPSPTMSNKPRKNEEYAELMEKLSIIMQKRGDAVRSRTYKRAQETILAIQEDITKPQDLLNKPNIGKTIIEKLIEYDTTGTLQLLEREKNNPEHVLSDVYGVGPKKAKELVESGITTIEQLREQQDKLLNKVQKIGLQYYEDILKPIPRNEIDEYNTVIRDVFEKIKTEDSRYEIVGSYRRGKSSSGDIDIIITSKNIGLFVIFIDKLIELKVIVEVLSRGDSKCLVVSKLGNYPARRVDFLFSTPEEYPYAILYFTGSKGFNATMRGHALKKGYSLNEHGLSKIEDKKKVGEKLLLNISDEKGIFDFLELEYKEPRERIDGRNVIPKVSKKESPEESPKSSPKVSKKESPKSSPKKIDESEIQHCKQLLEKYKQEKREKRKKTSPKTKKMKSEKDIKQKPQTKKRMPKVKAQEQQLPNTTPKEEAPPTKNSTQDADTAIQNIKKFKENGISAIETLSQSELSNMIMLSSDKYYNSNSPLMTDNEYDIVKEYIQNKFPQNEAVAQIGAPISGKNKVKLPYEMWSMDKIKPDSNALSSWVNKYKGSYVLSCKLDGVSGLYSTEGPQPKLYTRGDGKVGQDISHLLPMMKFPDIPNIVVRGEFIIPKAVFNEKYATTFANPRNLVSGIVNAKNPDEKTKDMHFVAYEVIIPEMKPSEQLKKLTEHGFEVVENKTYSSITNELLSDYLQERRANYMYEIDGIIVTNDAIYPRISGNPDHAFAFKMVLSDQKAEAKVVDVFWEASKDGYLKPRVRIEPIQLGGVTITYATGYNAKFIEENKIGIGAIVEIIRSGDVIPKIILVSSPAEKAKMPNVAYNWNDTHVDILLQDISSDRTVQEKNITMFFTELEVDGLKAGNVKKIMDAGYTTIPQILKMKEDDFKKAGFKTMATKYVENIDKKIKEASLLTIMVASGTLGRGLGNRKLGPIMEKYPDILMSPESSDEKIAKVKTVQGIEQKTAKLFVENIPTFLEFLRSCELEDKLSEIRPSKPPTDTSHPLYGKKIVMTKVRDAQVIDSITKNGGILEDLVKSDTFALIVKSKEDVSNKMKEAEKKGVPVMTLEEFKAKYME